MRVCRQVRDGASSIYEHVCMKECGSSLHLSKCICIPLKVGMGVFANVSKIETMVKYCKSVFCCCSY